MLNLPRPRVKKIDSKINIVPYIDVMLVLLIIFMMTTPIIEQGIEIDLPQAASGEIVDFSQNYPTIININKKGHYYINTLDSNNDIDNYDNKKLSLSVLVGRIKARLEIYPNMQIFIRADKSVEYKFIVNLMSFLQQYNIKKIGLITESVNL